MNININNNFNGNNININIVNRNSAENMHKTETHPIPGLDQKMSIENMLKQPAIPQQKTASVKGNLVEPIAAKPGTFTHGQIPVFY